jgi:hypothetical protein
MMRFVDKDFFKKEFLKGRSHVTHYTGCDFLFQETLIITPREREKKKRTVQPQDAFEDTDFKPEFKVVKF